MKILVTNDDSHRSPLLELALDYFSNFGEVVLVVPEHEQSWMGKRMTRFEPVHVRETELFGRKAFAVTGSPADCANLGIHNLLGSKPDLVVSGINAGFNIGIGFLLSSGTIGACLEGNIAGVPAIALSQAFDTVTRNRYVDDYLIEKETIARFREQTTTVLDRFTKALFSEDLRSEALSTPITWNVNFPFDLTDSAIVRGAPMGRTRYGRCFQEQSSLPGAPVRVYQHGAIEEVRDNTPTCDSEMLRSGCATVTPINMWRFVEDCSCDSLVERVLGRL